MDPIKITAVSFSCGLIGILLGGLARRRLSPEQLSPEAKDAIRLSLGLLVSLSALVLSLLVVGAKSGYEMRRSEINQITAGVLLLDHLLWQYGREAEPARAALRKEIPVVVDRIWSEEQSPQQGSRPFKSLTQGEALYQLVLDLKPANETQRQLQARITQSLHQIAELRLLLFSHFSSSIPVPFVSVLLAWIVILFSGFALLAPPHSTPTMFLIICALSVSGAMFLLLELDQPFSGIMMIPDGGLRGALGPIE